LTPQKRVSRVERQQGLLSHRQLLKETQAKILDYHIDQIGQRARDHKEVIRRLKENRVGLLDQRMKLQS
jgi:hypothetical protein